MKRLMKCGGTVAMVCVLLSGCSHNEDMYNPDLAGQRKAEYVASFEQEFGKVNPNVDWGFGADSAVSAQRSLLPATRGAETNANEWGRYVTVPDPLTDAQKAIVSAWFAAHQNPTSIAVNWCDFFAQQVSSTSYGSYMNQLCCEKADGTNSLHLNNFNNGDCSTTNVCGYLTNPNDQNSGVMHSDKIMFMTSANTDVFSYHGSMDNNTYRDKFVIIPGDMIDPSVAGMYFVGFDFTSNGEAENQKVAADGYYNDWIVKVTPAIYKNYGDVTTKRIIAEDLGAIGDWDFNDVVLDVAIRYNQWWHGNDYTVVTVLAAGGTMPVYIGEGTEHEVHAELGISTKEMANTGNGSSVKPIAMFRIPTVASANDVKITVDNNGTLVVLEAQKGQPAEKIAVPTTFRWCKERTNIKTVYGSFAEYVGNPTGNTDWYNKNILDENGFAK